MGFMTTAMKQTAVYWGSPVLDGFGKLSFDTPVEIQVRWSDKMELFINTMGKEELSNGVVYSSQDLDMKGYLYLGNLTDLTVSQQSDPLTIDTVRIIEKTVKIPALNALDFIRKVWIK